MLNMLYQTNMGCGIYNIVLKKNLFSHIYGMDKQVNASTNNIYLIHIRKYKTQ